MYGTLPQQGCSATVLNTDKPRLTDRIEPYSVDLQHQRQIRVRGDQLLKQIGQMLMIQHKILGRVEIV